ncbi:hypothetical protein FORC82_p182 (plasmid) [Escherichia coli]|nr:hypothetical protein FORC82_p182 [Escherichia coli]
MPVFEAAQATSKPRWLSVLAKRYPASKLTIEVFEPAQDIPDWKRYRLERCSPVNRAGWIPDSLGS